MAHRIICAFLVLGVLLAVGGVARAELVAWWKFDELVGSTAFDASGSANVHDATVHGMNPTFVVGGGRFGGAIYLPGVDEYVRAADHDDLEFPAGESFSVAMWYRSDGTWENDQGLITKGYHDTSRDSSGYYQLQTRSGGFTFDSREGAGGDPRVRLDAGGGNDTDWHHFVVVRDYGNNQVRLYVDNDATPLIHNMGNGNWDMGDHGDPLVIGNHYNRYTRGYFDDIGIWKGEVLTANDIGTIYRDGIQALAGPAAEIPEPATFVLVLLGLAAVGRRVRKRRMA